MCLVIGQSPLRRKIDLTHPALVPVRGNLLWMHLVAVPVQGVGLVVDLGAVGALGGRLGLAWPSFTL
jgi:hypothetical protein